MRFLVSVLRRAGVSLFLCLGATAPALRAQVEPPIYLGSASSHPVVGAKGMVVSREKISTQAAAEVLRKGGNAIDAAVTLGFALAVTLPQAGNLGGGGFMMVRHAESGDLVAIDYREKAPLAAHRDMFLDVEGNVDGELSRYSHQAAGVPGTVAGLALALEKYGTITLAEALQPAIDLAENGFPVGRDLYTSLKTGQPRIAKHSPEALKIFYHQDGSPYRPGEILKLPALAKSLKLIAKEGPDAFYQGEIARKIVADMEANNGLITKEDLDRYRPAIRKPVRGTYKGLEVYAMPPPSSGGVHVVQMLNVMEGLDLKSPGHNSAQTIHLMAETMKYAYADRSKHLGDSDFSPVPLEWLISKAYAAEIRPKLNLTHATPSVEILPGEAPEEGENTTHFSVMDAAGNAVSNTYTVNFSFGSKIMPAGTGFFLNNEMDDFSSKPGVPNAYGLIGGEFNAIEAEKRMLSSMSPTIVMRDGVPFLLTGSRGGSMIINVAVQIILNVVEHDMNIAEAVAASRVHHQWLPDVLGAEKGVSADTIARLKEMGYEIRGGRSIGTAGSAMFDDGYFYGAPDPRVPDSWAEGL